jgi:hypothetical protein
MRCCACSRPSTTRCASSYDSRLGQFPLGPIPTWARSHLGRFPLTPIPTCADSQLGRFPLTWARSRLGRFPLLADSRFKPIPTWAIVDPSAAQLHIRISFSGPHSELPVSSYSLVHRDRHSRPARAPVHAPAHLPSHVASPITHTPARSESARQSAPRGGCRFVPLSAEGSFVSRLVTTGWAVLASSQPRDFARDDAPSRLFRYAKYGLAPV